MNLINQNFSIKGFVIVLSAVILSIGCLTAEIERTQACGCKDCDCVRELACADCFCGTDAPCGDHCGCNS